MIELQVEAEVTESRQVTITLPPEVPLGRVRLSVGISPPPAGSLPLLRALDAEPGPDGCYRSGLVIVEGLPGPPG
jgi:hypothetical protein